MKMPRKELLEKLELVAPALSSTEIIPILTHFWFSGTHLLAYDDRIAIETPLKTEFTGALPGNRLIALLHTSPAPEAEIVVDKGAASLKLAAARLKLAVAEQDEFVFTMPEPAEKGLLKVKREALVDVIDCCLQSIGVDTSSPEQLGITFIPDGEGKALVCSTNAATLTFGRIAMDGLRRRVTLSSQFCEQMLRMLKRNKDTFSLSIAKDHSLLTVGKDVLFGRLIDTPRPLDFAGIISHHLPNGADKRFVQVPTKLEKVLERAIIMGEAEADKPAYMMVRVEARDDQNMIARFSTESRHGEANDTILVAAKHGGADLRVQPKLLRSGYGRYDEMLMTDQCAVMRKGSTYYMVAAASE